MLKKGRVVMCACHQEVLRQQALAGPHFNDVRRCGVYLKKNRYICSASLAELAEDRMDIRVG